MRARFLFGALLALLPALALAQSNVGSGGGGAGGNVTVTNFPANQPVSLQSLPAFAQTPTFNLGTLNGAALDTSVQAVKTALGSPLQAGGAVSVSNFPSTQAVSLASVPSHPVTNAGTFATQVTSLPSLPAGSNAIGSVSVSNFPASQAVTGTFWQATQPVSAASLPLPSGAATAVNQSSEITALQTIQQRALLYQDFGNTSAGASAVVSSAIRDLGASPNFTKVNLVAFSTQAGTYKILGCQDSACATPLTLVQSAITAGGYVTLSAPVITRYYLLQYTNGATAGAVYANTSFTAN